MPDTVPLQWMGPTGPQFDVFDNYPGFDKSRGFLEQIVINLGAKSIADVGGGANPRLDEQFIRENGIDYSLLDISQEELDKAPKSYRKFKVDLTAAQKEFTACVGEERFDLVFSHFFLEHVPDALQVHRNICSSLRRGGVAVHFFPSPRCLPLFINSVLPESITRVMLRVAQPDRDLDGNQGKFPAYYNMCKGPSKAMTAALNEIGYDVIRHAGFVGHNYYARVPGLRQVEHALRPVFVKWRIPLTSFVLLVLRKR